MFEFFTGHDKEENELTGRDYLMRENDHENCVKEYFEVKNWSKN